MTAKQLIKRLQILEKEYPRRHVYVDLESRNKNMDGDWTLRMVEEAQIECHEMGDDDGGLKLNSKDETIPRHSIVLKVN